MPRRNLFIVVVLGLGLCSCGGGNGSVASFCSLVKADHSHFADASTAAGRAELAKVQRTAPSPIKADLKTLVDYANDAAAAKTPPSSADLTKLVSASRNVEKYVKDKCRIDLSSKT